MRPRTKVSEGRRVCESYIGVGEVIKLVYDIFGGLYSYHIVFAIGSSGDGFSCYARVGAVGRPCVWWSGSNNERSRCVADDNRAGEVNSGV